MRCRSPEATGQAEATDAAAPPAPRSGLDGEAALYIYYRAPREQAAALIAAFGRLLEAARNMPGPAPRLMRRPAGDDMQTADTWMEVWSSPVQHFGDLSEAIQRIDAQAARSGLTALLDGSRHHEYFETVMPARSS